MSRAPAPGFQGRFLSKLTKVDRGEIENFLGGLVREKHFLQTVLNALDDGLVVLRPDLAVAYANDAALDLLGVNPMRRLEGSRLADLAALPGLRDLLARFAIRRERIAEAAVDGRGTPPRPLVVTIIPLDGDPPGAGPAAGGSAVVIIRDASDQRRAAEELRRADRADTLAVLTAGLAHEIKNPLNSLKIHAQLLKRGMQAPAGQPPAAPERLAHSCDVMLEEIDRLAGVVDQFLTATRPTRPQVEPVDVNRIAAHVADTLGPEAEARGIAVRTTFDHEMPAVDADPNQLTQAIMNLVKNAMEALAGFDAGNSSAADGGPTPVTPRVVIRTESAAGTCRIRIADNGPGMDADTLRRMFEPYYTTKASGTGLGLSVVSRVLQDHGGRLDVESQPGRGTAMTICLPMAGARLPGLIGESKGGFDTARSSVGPDNV